MSSKLEFAQEVDQCLMKLDRRLDDALFQLINHTYPSEVVCLSFEIFVDSFTTGFPIRCFFMDKDNCEFFLYENGKAAYPSPIDPDLLDINYVYPVSLEEKYLSIEDELWDIATEQTIKWFANRWFASGGNKFSLNANIACHDDVNEYDLVKNKWANNNDS